MSDNTKTVLHFEVSTQIIAGEGTIGQLPDVVRSFDGKKALIVTDKGIAQSGILDRVLQVFRNRQMDVEVFDDVLAQPTSNVVLQAFGVLKDNQCDVVVALGGGSSIDTAKGVAILATNGGHPRDYSGFNKFSTPPLPVIAIPTTAGTGSEVSYVASITDEEAGQKMSIRHTVLNRPKVAILDPTLLATLPRGVAIVTSMDALTHNIESYTSLEANYLSQAVSLHGIELIGRWIRTFVANRANVEAADAMLQASTMGGIGFTAAGTGNVHCLARFLASDFKMEHGMACAVALPYVVRFNAWSDVERFSRVAVALGERVDGLTPHEAANRAYTAVRKICDDLGIPRSLAEFGVKPEHIDDLAEKAFSAGYDRWNPRQTSLREWKELIRDMVEGRA